MDSSENKTNEEVEELEWTPEQEVMLLYSLDGLKPVGQHKHFRMLGIQDRLSNAMNQEISTKAIWDKLNTLYDLETLDDAEAEADAAVAVVAEFSLPEDEFGELIAVQLKGMAIKVEPCNTEDESDDEVSKITPKSLKSGQASKTSNEVSVEQKKSVEEDKENSKASTDTEATKIGLSLPKNKGKETHKEISSNRKGTSRAEKKICLKEVDKKESDENTVNEDKRDFNNDDKTERVTKRRKKETEKLITHWTASNAEAVKEGSNMRKKKDSQDKNMVKSPEKLPETGAKLRIKEKKLTESEKSGTGIAGKKLDLSRHSMSKVSDLQTEELQTKRVRSTRNSSGLSLPQEKRQKRLS